MANWRKTREYRTWRARVIRRDKRCVVCGSIKRRNAHHMNHASFFPEQRFDEKNGVTLCGSCHVKFHNDYKRSTRVKCTKYDFRNFLSLAKYFMKLQQTS